MKTNFYLFLITFIIGISAYSNNDKYRIILNDDPTSTITVAWNQISGTNPQVYYDTVDHGTNYQLYNNVHGVDRSVVFRGMDNHFSRLTGLQPDTAYYFVIHDSEGTSQRFWFKTAPDDNSRLSFVAGGDSRNNRTPRQKANQLVSKLKPHAVFFGGDMTDDDTNAEWQDWFDDWQLSIAADGRMFPFVATRGNHESPSSVYNLFDTPTQDSYYAITFGNDLIRCYTLNSEISVLGNQLTWLQNDLANNTTPIWKMAQYHKPMRPHTAGKSEGNTEYNAWAQLFYDENVNLVVDCDSHMSKTTWPVKPSSGPNNDEGFEIDFENGTVYTGEGCWGAPLRPNNDDKSWTRNSGVFNQFKLVFVDVNEIEMRTIKVDNADSVGENPNDDPFQLPTNLDVFSPSSGAVITINQNSTNNPCVLVGTTCDDGDPNTLFDEEDGLCNCEGLNNLELTEEVVEVSASSDDAEESIATGTVDLTSNDLELIYDNEDQMVGVRFDNVQMPKDATLYRAFIQFTTDETDAGQDPTNLVISGELSVDSPTFMASDFNISSRQQTLSAINWNDVGLWDSAGEEGLVQRTPYLTNIVSEITSQNSWGAGNAITFMISGSGKRVAEAFDGSAPPKLKLYYQTPCLPELTTCDDGDPNTFFDIEDGDCLCEGLPQNGTYEVQVSESNDDAEEGESGALYVNSSDLELVYDTFSNQFNQTIGIRFQDIKLPSQATINNAYIQFTVDEDDADQDPTNLIIHGENTGSALAFEGMNNNITSRALTNSQVAWNNVPIWDVVGESGVNQQTPDISPIIQEILDRPDWNQLNDLAIIISGTGKRVAEAFDGNQDDAPKLIIDYTLDTSGCPVQGTPCDDGNPSTILDEEDGNCNCIGVPDSAITQDNPVINSSDDAEEEVSTGVMDITSSDLELTFESGSTEQLVGLRFDDVTLPEGSTIYRAYIQFQVDDDNTDNTNLVIQGEKSASSTTFNTSVGDISTRTLTSNQVQWNDVPEWNTVGDAGLDQRTPYLTFLVDEITGLPDWNSGDALTFIISGTGEREAEAFDGSAAPILRIIYDSPCPEEGTACDDGDPTTLFDIEDGNCNCAGIPEIGTTEIQIANSENDAEEGESGAMYVSSSDIEMVYDTFADQFNQTIGLRFPDLNLPQNSIITNAYIQFTVDEDDSDQDPTNLVIEGENVGNSAIFEELPNNITSRSKTTSQVNWNNVPLWTAVGDAGLDQQTPDISGIIQEILNRPDWSQNNALSIIISGTGKRVAESFDGNSNSAPKLVIEYDLSNLSVQDQNLTAEELKVYPNPTDSYINLEINTSSISKVSVFDMTGKLIETTKHSANQVRLDTNSLNSGNYFLKVETSKGSIFKRFIKR